jgi:hypothetical protein
MATTSTFSNMLNEFVGEKMLMAELKKRDWVLSNVELDTEVVASPYILPFLSNVGSTVTFGSLAADTDIAEEQTLRGEVTYAEAWSSMIFQEMDLMEHGKVSEQNFLKILPDALKRHLDFFKYTVSTGLLAGNIVSKLTADGDASGNITVADPERFPIGMKVIVDDDDSAASSAGYVRTVDMNTGVLVIYDARSGGSVVNLSAYTTAQNAVVYADGQQSNGFTSLKSILLPASVTGGSASYAGLTKANAPILQAIVASGSDISASNILEKIFDHYVTTRKRGGGKPFKVIMSYKNFGSCLKALENTKGAFNVMQGSKKAEVYGWDEIEVGGFAGVLSLVAVQEMADSEIYFLDLESWKFVSNGGFRRRKSPEGIEYFTKRATTGYSYVVDHCLKGNIVCKNPAKNGVLHSISY